MIAERVRHQKDAGLEIRLHLNWNYSISMDRGQPDLPSGTHPELVRILLAHVNEAVREELSL
jgi:hypothetical protein